MQRMNLEQIQSSEPCQRVVTPRTSFRARVRHSLRPATSVLEVPAPSTLRNVQQRNSAPPGLPELVAKGRHTIRIRSDSFDSASGELADNSMCRSLGKNLETFDAASSSTFCESLDATAFSPRTSVSSYNAQEDGQLSPHWRLSSRQGSKSSRQGSIPSRQGPKHAFETSSRRSSKSSSSDRVSSDCTVSRLRTFLHLPKEANALEAPVMPPTWFKPQGPVMPPTLSSPRHSLDSSDSVETDSIAHHSLVSSEDIDDGPSSRHVVRHKPSEDMHRDFSALFAAPEELALKSPEQLDRTPDPNSSGCMPLKFIDLPLSHLPNVIAIEQPVTAPILSMADAQQTPGNLPIPHHITGHKSKEVIDQEFAALIAAECITLPSRGHIESGETSKDGVEASRSNTRQASSSCTPKVCRAPYVPALLTNQHQDIEQAEKVAHDSAEDDENNAAKRLMKRIGMEANATPEAQTVAISPVQPGLFQGIARAAGRIAWRLNKVRSLAIECKVPGDSDILL